MSLRTTYSRLQRKADPKRLRGRLKKIRALKNQLSKLIKLSENENQQETFKRRANPVAHRLSKNNFEKNGKRHAKKYQNWCETQGKNHWEGQSAYDYCDYLLYNHRDERCVKHNMTDEQLLGTSFFLCSTVYHFCL